MANNTELTIPCGLLRVRFFRIDDRFGHRFEIVSPDEPPQLLLESIESTPDDHWPASPPFQQVEPHVSQQTISLLAVGLAGSSHWSAAIDGLPRDSSQPARIRFDVACRTPESASPMQTQMQTQKASLSSTYRIGDEISVEKHDSEIVLGVNDSRRIHLTTTCEVEFENGRQLVLRPSRLPNADRSATSATIRWTYDLCPV